MPNGLSEAPWLKTARSARSAGRSLGRLTCQRSTFSWCRSTRISMSLEPSSAELATRRATARTIRERRNGFRACYGSASWKANRSSDPLQVLSHHLVSDSPVIELPPAGSMGDQSPEPVVWSPLPHSLCPLSASNITSPPGRAPDTVQCSSFCRVPRPRARSSRKAR
jgi:hypothetical protein